MIYLYSADFKNQGDDLYHMMPLLDEDRQEKVEKYRFYKDKALSIYAYLLLRFALKKEWDIDTVPNIIVGSRGKPYLRDMDISFNISHCDNAVACVVARSNVGIDVQDYSDKLANIKDSFLTEKEIKKCRFYQKDIHLINELARYWTLKEAYGKYHGYGICYSMNEEDFSDIGSCESWQKHRGLKVYSNKTETFAISVFANRELDVRCVSRKDIEDGLYRI